MVTETARTGDAAPARARRRSKWLYGFPLLLVAALAVWALYVLLGPGPYDFADGKRVAMAPGSADDPSGVPPSLRNASLVERGEYLARASDCVVCHTAPDGRLYEGGRAFVLPFGTLYATNITPDNETGIGQYSDKEFIDAVRRGIRRDSAKLYPAMPYPSYSYMSDADALAIKAYLFTLKPLHTPARPSTLAFPFDQRPLMTLWNAFFSSDKRYEVNDAHDARWNRGAYLAEALGHCGECHTPRTAFFSLDNRSKYAGEIQDGWHAFNISPDQQSGIGAWSQSELVSYLSTGDSGGHGTASGPMAEVVSESLSRLAPDDIDALATYVRSTRPERNADLPGVRTASAGTPFPTQARADDPGSLIFAQSCAGCHGWSGENAALKLSRLIGNRAVNDPKATNVVRIILDGGTRHPRENTSVMPAFGETYTDAQIAAVASFVVARFGSAKATVTERDVEKARQLSSPDVETQSTASR